MNEAIDDNVDRPGGRVILRALHDNVLSGLEFGLAAGASKRGVWKEVLAVFANGGVACGHASETGTQGVGKANDGEPGATFSVCGRDDMLLLVLKVKE